MRTSEARKREEDARRRVEQFVEVHERRREVAQRALAAVYSGAGFDEADALLDALEDAGGALVVPS